MHYSPATIHKSTDNITRVLVSLVVNYSIKMNCVVVVCAVLLVTGNVDSFGVNRTSTDLEKTLEEVFDTEYATTEQTDLDKAIRDLYGSPVISNLDRFLTMTNVDTKTSTTEKAEEIIPQSVLDQIFGSGKSFPEPNADADPSVNSASVGGEKDTASRMNDKDVNAVLSSIPESTPVYEDYLDSNTTRQNFTNDDRFLTEDLINKAWDNNIQEEDESHLQRHLRIPTEHTKLRGERNLTPKGHILMTSPKHNAASKSDVSSFLVLFVLNIICILCL